jgi:phytoene dehydrogenase-like protein
MTRLRDYQLSSRQFTLDNFENDHVHAFILGWAMAPQTLPDQLGTVADIDKQYSEMARGLAPSDPFLWTAAWTTMDPTRAPDGKHTLIMDTFVPVDLASGEDWESIAADYVRDKLLSQLRNYASNMTDDNIMGQYIETGPSLACANLCFHRGVTTGGERTLAQLDAFRPFPNYADYRGPVKKFYMTGPSCHPGGGMSGMGTIAANEILLDLGIREDDDFDF